VEVEAAHAGGLGQRIQIRFVLRLLDQAAGARHRLRLALGQRRQVRRAAQAGPEARRLGRLAAGMEGDVGALGPARRARGPAIDAGSAHRIIKTAVGAGIAPLYGVPARIVVDAVDLVAIQCRHDGVLLQQ